MPRRDPRKRTLRGIDLAGEEMIVRGLGGGRGLDRRAGVHPHLEEDLELASRTRDRARVREPHRELAPRLLSRAGQGVAVRDAREGFDARLAAERASLIETTARRSLVGPHVEGARALR